VSFVFKKVFAVNSFLAFVKV